MYIANCRLQNKFEITIDDKINQFLSFQMEHFNNRNIKIHQTIHAIHLFHIHPYIKTL